MNNPDTLRSERLQREKLLFRYTTALDRGDFDAIAEVLIAAEADSELAHMIAEMNEAAAAHQSAEFRTTGQVSTKRRSRFPTLALLLSTIMVVLVFSIAGLFLAPGLMPGVAPQSVGVGDIDGGAEQLPPQATQVAMLPTQTVPGMIQPQGTMESTASLAPAGTQGSDQGSPVAPIEPMIIKNGDIRMIVENVPRAIDSVTLIASDSGGYVLSSQSWSADGRASAAMTIAVRADQFDTAMRRLRDLAMEVVQESASGQDVSTEYVDLQSRLRNLEATRDRIKGFLDQATTVEEALNINEQLAEIEAEIEQVKGRMTYLSGRAAFSTITVSMDEYIPVTPSPTPTPTLTPTPTRPWSLGPRIDEAIDTQTDLARGLLEVLVWLIIVPGPYLLLGAIIFVVVRIIMKRTQ